MSANNKFDYRWLVGGAAILAALGITIGISLSHPLSPQDALMRTAIPDRGDEKINWDRYASYDIDLSTWEPTTITKSGTYHLTGSLRGGIRIEASTSEVRLLLDNVTIENPSGPAILCLEAEDLVVELIGENTLKDSAKYDTTHDIDVIGAIYSKSDLIFQGNGTLNLTASYQDGIVGKDDVKFNSGTFKIESADDAIRGKDSVYIKGGTISVKSGADGIKSTNLQDPGKGFILIDGGTINIEAGDDGLRSSRTIIMNDGTLNIAKAYEGVEARSVIFNGGTTHIKAFDDGVNANGAPGPSTVSDTALAFAQIIVNGGELYVNSNGDGLDSNNHFAINGGKIVVDGPANNGNSALDSESGIVITGGEIIALGMNAQAEPPSQESSARSVIVYLPTAYPASTHVEIRDEEEESIIAHTSAKSFNNIIVSSPLFMDGHTYTLLVDDVEKTKFTISGFLTTLQ